MTFIILGSGTHFPDPEKRSAGYLLRISETTPIPSLLKREHKGRFPKEHLVLFDFGYGTLLRLVELKVRYQDIGHIFFTHTHEDHYLDLLPFLNTMYLQAAQWGLHQKTIRLYGPKGFQRKFQKIQAAMGRATLKPFIDIRYRELTQARVKIGKLIILSHPVRHMLDTNALCYRIKGKLGELAYTGDLDYDERIIPFLKDVHTLVIECGFPNHMKKVGHMTPAEAGRVAHRASAKRIVLTHRYPPCDAVNVAAQCRNEFSGTILLAQDKLSLRV